MTQPDPSLIIQRMQDAVDIVLGSEHLNNKISACLFNDNFHVARVNHRPQPLKDTFAADARIGDSSQFVHSEIACIHAASQAVDGSYLCVTDPFCPNCAKGIAESGIKHVYIDHKGLDKDFANRRGDDFESLSLLIMEKAGIDVSVVYRKEGRIEPLVTCPIHTRWGASTGVEFFDIAEDMSLEDMLQSFRTRQPHSAWACARIQEKDGSVTGILVFQGLSAGITPYEFNEKKHISDKYSLTIDPVNRLIFYLKRKGLYLVDSHIGCNLFPSSRAMVNAIGFGVTTLTVGENEHHADPDRHDAGDMLEKNGILKINRLYSLS